MKPVIGTGFSRVTLELSRQETYTGTVIRQLTITQHGSGTSICPPPRRDPPCRTHPTEGRATLIRITRAGREIADAATAAINRDFFNDVGLAADGQAGVVEIQARPT
ncbi:MAG: hypothetical protein ABIW81_09015 [Terrimesophilobacter sp.]